MAAHPILVERPIFIVGAKAVVWVGHPNEYLNSRRALRKRLEW